MESVPSPSPQSALYSRGEGRRRPKGYFPFSSSSTFFPFLASRSVLCRFCIRERRGEIVSFGEALGWDRIEREKQKMIFSFFLSFRQSGGKTLFGIDGGFFSFSVFLGDDNLVGRWGKENIFPSLLPSLSFPPTQVCI